MIFNSLSAARQLVNLPVYSDAIQLAVDLRDFYLTRTRAWGSTNAPQPGAFIVRACYLLFNLVHKGTYAKSTKGAKRKQHKKKQQVRACIK